MNKTDRTGKQRQARRRKHEKKWLNENGWRSWEALHTALMNGTARLISDTVDTRLALDDRQISATTNHR